MTDLDSPLPSKSQQRKFSWVLLASYVSDWICLIAAGLVGTFLGNVTPNKRPFRLTDPNIAYVLPAEKVQLHMRDGFGPRELTSTS